MVAILCNHQRAAPKTHDQSMAKMKEKLRGFKLEVQETVKYVEESDLDEYALTEHEEVCKAREMELAEMKHAEMKPAEMNLAEEGKDTQGEDVLRSRLRAIKDEFRRDDRQVRREGRSSCRWSIASTELIHESSARVTIVSGRISVVVDAEAVKRLES
ncbi:hypothetical protein DFH94DRAFT_684419 [Russula ochroleuca]|uniref:DNA topoisomerase I catalytic core eukaryotic-type domain-containing protein n=1 Tax=Russula ochroleuca TaxID=152965 RepID=A0A9P5JZ84_9AGAM|nr:hypothetical protein DFH94DRAFT_684419 [Russula ochroleuca]